MPFMLKIRWDIKEGSEADFRANQEQLCEVMLEHPGVITYHVEYPSPRVSEWTEVYATDAAFKAHLDNERGKAPLGAVVAACDTITCRCFGEANDEWIAAAVDLGAEAVAGAVKDAGLALDAVAAMGLEPDDLALVAAAREHLDRAVAEGHGDLDIAATYLSHRSPS